MIYNNVKKYNEWLTWIFNDDINESEILNKYMPDFPIMRDIDSLVISTEQHPDTEICNPVIVCV
jgi:hypothetical protein